MLVCSGASTEVDGVGRRVRGSSTRFVFGCSGVQVLLLRKKNPNTITPQHSPIHPYPKEMLPAFVVEEFVGGVGEEVGGVDVPDLKAKAIAQAQADRPEELRQVQLCVDIDQVGMSW